METTTTPWERSLPDGRCECLLCPRHCRLGVGQPGFCLVRENQQGHIVSRGLAHWSGGCVDPIEKKPLYHFLPGARVYSFGTQGCNLGCRFCQNWHLSHAHAAEQNLLAATTPDRVVTAALRENCPAVAFTYNDPVIYAEEAIATAHLCHEHGLSTIAVTAGYIEPAPRRAFFAAMDAANIDLKSFRDEFYRRQCAARLGPVLDTLRHVHEETSVWLEVTTLLIPGENDSAAELDEITDWFATYLGPDVPWHFSAFHPDYHWRDHPRTPGATLRRARTLAMAKGMRYVYTGNVPDAEGSTTRCPGCGTCLIERAGFAITRRHDADGRCPDCGRRIAGVMA